MIMIKCSHAVEVQTNILIFIKCDMLVNFGFDLKFTIFFYCAFTTQYLGAGLFNTNLLSLLKKYVH